MEGETVTLETSDGAQYTVLFEVAKMSKMVINLVEDVGIEEVIPLPEVTGDVLEKVICYMKYYTENPIPPFNGIIHVGVEGSVHDLNDWDKAFLDVNMKLLFAIIMAANYLEIANLLDVACKTVANRIKGKTPEQIREFFGVKNDFTAEEEAMVKAELSWLWPEEETDKKD